MVLIWNDLACGNREAAAFLVAVNSVFQIAAYSLLGYFYLELLPGWLGLDQESLNVSIWEIAKSVLIFLGLPLLRSEEHTSELQSLMRISYAVFCLKKKKKVS